MNRLPTRLLPVFAALALAGCVSAPKVLDGAYAPVQPGEVARSGATGDVVRWGGRIVRVDPLAAQSCFEIVGVRVGSAYKNEANEECDNPLERSGDF